MRVQQSRHDLVNRVVRHRHAAAGTGLALDTIKGGRGECREVTVLLERVLAFRKFGHQVVDVGAERRVARGHGHARRRGEIVPRHVASDEPAFPAAVGPRAFGLRQARQGPVMEQQPVGLERGNVSPAMQLLPFVERAARKQPDAGGIQRLQAAGKDAVCTKQRQDGKTDSAGCHPAAQLGRKARP